MLRDEDDERWEGRSAREGRKSLSVVAPYHDREDHQARDNRNRDGRKQPDRLHERAQESADIGPHDPFSTAKMGHHLGSNCSRSLPAKGRIAGYTELARISQRVMRISSSDACRFRRTGVTEYPAGHSGFAPENLTTLPHFSVSSAMSLPKSATEPGSTMPPRSANRAFNLGSASPALISLLSLLMISDAVFLGALRPTHWLASKPGTKSPMVGISGSASERIDVVTAKARHHRAQMGQ